jgi:branched-chain amino acid transport system permease protein
MLGGLALGVIETLAAGLISSEYKNIIMYGLLLAILMFFFRPDLPAGRSAGDGVRARLRGQTLAKRRLAAVSVMAGLLWLTVPLLAGAYEVRVMNLAMVFGIAVLGLQLIVGYTGQLSFGHAAFFGIGAYTAAILAMKLGQPVLVTLPCATLTAALAGLILTPVLRLSGHYLAIATLAMGEIVFLLINTLKSVTNGAYGLYGIPAPGAFGVEIDTDEGFFVLASLVMFAVLFVMHRLTGSRFGRALLAVRENERAALASGIDATRLKTQAFVIGSACAGLAGGLYAHYSAYINPNSFTFETSVEMVTMVVIGGLGSMVGGLIGALAVVAMPEYLRWLAEYRLIIYGGLLVLFMIFLPGGLMDVVRMAVLRLQPNRLRALKAAPP